MRKNNLIEPYNGTLTTLFYNETLSNGESFIDFIYVSDVHNGTHVTTLDEKDKKEIRPISKTIRKKSYLIKLHLNNLNLS